MRHFTTQEFWVRLNSLPPEIQRLARRNYRKLRENPRHPSLRFKRVGRYWAARVGLDHRALAAPDKDDFVWFWIGPHDEYDRLIR